MYPRLLSTARQARENVTFPFRKTLRKFHGSVVASQHNTLIRNGPRVSSFPSSSSSQSSLMKWSAATNTSQRSFSSTPKIPPRALADLEERIWSTVGVEVKDPELDKNLKTLNWLNRRVALSDDGTVQILLNLPTLLHPTIDELKERTKVATEAVIRSWASDHSIDLEPKANVQALPQRAMPWMASTDEDMKDIETRLGPGLKSVSHFLAVYSCKGGVGKSTIATNLAYELARMGGRVGLLDVDVYGPSLPVLVHPDDPAVRQSPLGSGMVYPIDHRGVKMLSLGFVSPKSGAPGSGSAGGAAVMRGPMAGRVVAQLLKGTDWGELDVLILDLPPGTGDVQLAVCQDLQLSGAVGVTTPSKLAIADARKGIEMFSALGVPTLAVVENMSYFECEGGGRHYPFGRGFEEFLGEGTDHLNVKRQNISQLPISEIANDANDAGAPLCLTRPSDASKELDAFHHLAVTVSRELFRLPHQKQESGQMVQFSGSKDTFDIVSLQLYMDQEKAMSIRAFSESGAIQIKVEPKELRSRDPKTGDKQDNPSSGSSDQGKSQGSDPMINIHRASEANEAKISVPVSVEKKGGYGFAVEWADGATHIYSLIAIARAGGGVLKE